MPIFISYSHQDKKIVDRLAAQLVRNKVNVWLDRWELSVGDSLITRIQEAISGASALLVVLSKASVASEWCKKELTAGLIRELSEKTVVVMPVVIEACEIPLFLRDKLYADLRSDFDDGLRTILESIAKVTSASQSRLDSPNWHTDWAIDWSEQAKGVAIRLTFVEHGEGQPYTVVTTIGIFPDPIAAEKYLQLSRSGKGDLARLEVVGALATAVTNGLNLSVIIEDQFERTSEYQVGNSSSGFYLVHLAYRKLGEETGRDTLLHIGEQIITVHEHMRAVLKRPEDAPKA